MERRSFLKNLGALLTVSGVAFNPDRLEQDCEYLFEVDAPPPAHRISSGVRVVQKIQAHPDNIYFEHDGQMVGFEASQVGIIKTQEELVFQTFEGVHMLPGVVQFDIHLQLPVGPTNNDYNTFCQWFSEGVMPTMWINMPQDILWCKVFIPEMAHTVGLGVNTNVVLTVSGKLNSLTETI